MFPCQAVSGARQFLTPRGLMAEVLSWQAPSDSRAVVRRARSHLKAGRAVLIPTEAGYQIAYSATTHADPTPASDEVATVALRDSAEARDWAPNLGPQVLRLVKRAWPGPLALAVGPGTEQGLAMRLPRAIRDYLLAPGALRLWMPAHPLVQALGHRGAAPLVLKALPGGGGAPDAAAAGGDQVGLVIDAGPCHRLEQNTVVRVEGDSWSMLSEGAFSEEELRRLSACLIVFVCTGNTCRSPLAEGLFKKRLADRLGCTVGELPSRGFFVLSAGLAAMMGGDAAQEAVEVARSYGADLTGHQSRGLSADLASGADYLVAMTRSHVRALLAHYPRSGAPPRLLSPVGEDLPDPIGGDRAVYNECARCIWEHTGALVDELAPAPAPERDVTADAPSTEPGAAGQEQAQT